MFKQWKQLYYSAQRLLREQADIARDARDWRVAAALYEVHLRSYPDAGEAALWVQLGNCRKEAGDYDGALQAYRCSLDLAPERADTHLQEGRVHQLCGKLDHAGASYATALRLDPTCADAAAELAALEGEADAASRGRSRLASGGSGRADAARDAGNWSIAAALYAEYIAAGPEYAAERAAWVQLGHARKEAGDRDGAVLAYETALGLDPEDAETHVHLGHLHKTMGATAAAVEAFTEAIRLAPHRGDVEQDLSALVAVEAAPVVRRSSTAHRGDIRHATPLPWTDDRSPFQSPYPPIYAGLSRRFGSRDAGTP